MNMTTESGRLVFELPDDELLDVALDHSRSEIRSAAWKEIRIRECKHGYKEYLAQEAKDYEDWCRYERDYSRAS